MLRYAITIFLSAFLLFQVQPLIGRFILPWFGGGPSIWTACMLFFQLLLLGGYLYAHVVSSWLTPRRQAVVHLVMLAVSVICLPIAPSDAWKPEGSASPLLRILMLLLATVGGPYFLLASTGPLMQRWFSRTSPEQSPYRLYALSNAGSLLALVTYPFVFEPWLKLRTQVAWWSWMYGAYVIAAGWCAWRLFQDSTAPAERGATTSGGSAGTSPSQALSQGEPRPGLLRMLLWLGLSAAGSVMLLATTNQLCIDVATVPFLWILPLSLYLLTFIICFDSPRWYDRRVFGLVMLCSFPVACFLLDEGADTAITDQVIAYAATMFACCMVCHGELVALRPGPRHLTLFFVIMSAGGALGGVSVAIVAPAVFDGFWEYHIGLVACGVLATAAWMMQRTWRNPQSPAFWIWVAAVTVQVTVMIRQFYLPQARHLESIDHSIVFGVYGLLQVLSLLVTSLLARRTVLLMCLWPVFGLLPAVWLSGFGWLRFSSEMAVATYVTLAASAIGSVGVANGLLWAVGRCHDRMQQHLTRWGILAGAVVVLWALRERGWLASWQVFSLSCTILSALLMEWSASGFLGPKHKSLGFWFWVPSITILMLLSNRLMDIVRLDASRAVHMSRNFYGVLRVVEIPEDEDDDGNPIPAKYSLTHGQIQHGFQYRDEAWKRLPTTYYGRDSGIGLSIDVQRSRRTESGDGALRIGVVGLGTGSVAVYGEAGDVIRFYDINPAVKALSGPLFSYLQDTPATTDVVLGDARIEMERQLVADDLQQFDVLAIDAFSSDAIPVHLLTAECSELYKRHLKPDGVLAVHISNRFLNLEPVTRGMASHLGWTAIRIENDADSSVGVFTSDWILLTPSEAFASDSRIEEAATDWDEPDKVLNWTDDYSGLWQVLNW